jgi:hypothetical protein
LLKIYLLKTPSQAELTTILIAIDANNSSKYLNANFINIIKLPSVYSATFLLLIIYYFSIADTLSNSPSDQSGKASYVGAVAS